MQAWTEFDAGIRAFALHRPNNKRVARIVKMLNRGNIKHFFEYSDADNDIHPKRGFKLINRNFRVDSRRPVRREAQRIRRNPLQETVQEKLHKMSLSRDPLHATSGKPGSLGSYITIKVNPSAIHICIKKGVQEQALKMLADRIVEHAKGGPTRIILKQSQRGKYSYSEWISTKSLASMTAQTLFERLLKQTKNRTKYVNIILRQQHMGGAIHDRIAKSESLV